MASTTTGQSPELEQLGINVIRGLAMDAPQKANSGHPGTAMALAPLAHVLFTRIMDYDPTDPDWPDRDRFILSPGHACILLYSMLYLTGYGMELEDLKEFRQWGSRTPGHPEVHHFPGIEVTTGPLGQGFGQGVGMGIAERILRSEFGPDLVDHHTFVVCGDGDLMEGVSHEAASLAGHLGLGRLIYIYDDNHITIDGPTEITLDDDPAKRFEAYGWHVEDLGEVANDLDALESGIRRAMAVEDKPSFLILRSHIGYPSPKMTDSPKAHGDPFGDEEVAATKAVMGLPTDETFWVPEDVLQMYRQAGARGKAARDEWQKRTDSRSGDKQRWDALWGNRGVEGWQAKLPTWKAGDDAIATRKSINVALNAIAADVPGLSSGGADLTGNTGTKLDGVAQQSKEHPEGRQIAYGVREHGMGAVMNGLSLHGGVIPIGGTFFTFSDYMRGAVRIAALSEAKVIYFWTHDSVGLGQDGPTHQPVEQLASFRAMPGLRLIRPADANESAHALRIAIERNGPTALILSRQNLPVLEGTADLAAEGVERGAYVLVEGREDPDVVLIGTGSEVSVCVEAASILAEEGVTARVVSMPSWDLFDEQDEDYQDLVLGPGAPVLSVEAASSFGWARWADDSVAIDHFGASAPGATVLREFGFTGEHVAERAQALLDDLDSDVYDDSDDS
ncbi:transketolase [Acidiferrimicrobium sp. IK]|uniref:transketolase n=1 Tax=Acidiferrimicrobium sp. IK TaxID=2871700 RepID=UPI0021CB99BC|nr:transketolase [Acidiferrimicrobium sp. IK]MCU4184644.1 transketolase [Acidiferrimicrobium sp. IK]